jgi:hypothetical protein
MKQSLTPPPACAAPIRVNKPRAAAYLGAGIGTRFRTVPRGHLRGRTMIGLLMKLALDAALLPLLAYWRSKLSGRRLPSRGDIDLGEISALLPHVQLVENAAGRFRYDRVGSAIVEAYGTNPSGRFVDEYLPRDRRVLAWRNYAMVTELRCPLATRCTFNLGESGVVKTNRLLLPLIGEYGRVDAVMTGFLVSEGPRAGPLRLASAGAVDERAYAIELLSVIPQMPEPALVMP